MLVKNGEYLGFCFCLGSYLVALVVFTTPPRNNADWGSISILLAGIIVRVITLLFHSPSDNVKLLFQAYHPRYTYQSYLNTDKLIPRMHPPPRPNAPPPPLLRMPLPTPNRHLMKVR